MKKLLIRMMVLSLMMLVLGTALGAVIIQAEETWGEKLERCVAEVTPICEREHPTDDDAFLACLREKINECLGLSGT